MLNFADLGVNTAPPGGYTAVQTPTVTLINRIRLGEDGAREALFRRYLPVLRRWAHGRLPALGREPTDTDDLVQATLLRTLHHLEEFDATNDGNFLAYLRQILLGQVRDELRRQQRFQVTQVVGNQIADVEPESPVPLEQLIGTEQLAAYEAALAELPRYQQELIIMRMEFGLSYSEIATEVESQPNAVRVAISRAIVQLAQRLEVHRDS